MTTAINAVLVRPDGAVELVNLAADGAEAHESLLHLLGASALDAVALAPGVDMWVDAEHLHGHGGRNHAAELLTDDFSALIVKGTAVIAAADRRGSTICLTPEQSLHWRVRAELAARDAAAAIDHGNRLARA